MPPTHSNHELKQQLEQLQKKHNELNKKLQKKEAYFSTLLNNTSDSIIRIDRQLRPVYANQVFYDITGCTPDQSLGYSNEEIGLPRELYDLFREKHLEVFKNATPLKFEFKYPTANNETRLFEAQVSPEFNEEKNVTTLLSCIRDISELKTKEKALAQAQDQWQHTFNSISDWVSIIDDHCRILKTNKTCKNFIQKLPKEVVGTYCHEIIPHCLDINPCPLEQALKQRERISHEFQLPDGKWWLITVDPILGEGLPPCQAVHIIRDITVLKLRETQNIQSKKNAAFRVLAGGIAHDYNNLLAVIMGNLSLAIELSSQDDDRLDFLKEAEISTELARDLSHKFLAISGYEYSEKKIGRLNDTLKASVGEISSIEGLEVVVGIDNDLWPVNFDGAQMRIVFQNLLINSVESMPQGGTLTLGAENHLISQDIFNINYFKSPGCGRFVKVEIKDTGSGIPEQVLPKIFDPYFSTKQRGVQKGMGLGLAVVSSILENHGGTISIDSNEKTGTRVTLLIPAYDPKRVVQLGKTYFQQKRQGVRIMVMDDEIAMRRLMGNIIQSMGYEVELVEDSQAAIKVFKRACQDGAPFDLVILDQIICGDICGSDTLKKLKTMDEKVKSIVISGSPHSPTMTNYKEFGFDAALIKPYTRNEVNELLHHILN